MGLEKCAIYEAQGQTLEIMQAWQDRRDAADAARDAFAVAVAADAKVIGSSLTFYGISTSATLDTQEWKPFKQFVRGATAPCYEPNKKFKAGKALAKVMGEARFRVPDSHELSSDFKFSPFMTPAENQPCMAVHYIQGQKVGDKMILFVPVPSRFEAEGAEWIPEDARPLKLSEYHALIEQQQEIHAEAKA